MSSRGSVHLPCSLLLRFRNDPQYHRRALETVSPPYDPVNSGRLDPVTHCVAKLEPISPRQSLPPGIPRAVGKGKLRLWVILSVDVQSPGTHLWDDGLVSVVDH